MGVEKWKSQTHIEFHIYTCGHQLQGAHISVQSSQSILCCSFIDLSSSKRLKYDEHAILQLKMRKLNSSDSTHMQTFA